MDIVKWLRQYGWRNGTKTCGDRHDEAADEIEFLRKERDRLREALKEIATEEYIDPKMIAEEALWYSKAARAALKGDS
ncbi:hypothetical protein EBT31_16535 [bacterium]|nr:hypothetical protein [bacterium]